MRSLLASLGKNGAHLTESQNHVKSDKAELEHTVDVSELTRFDRIPLNGTVSIFITPKDGIIVVVWWV
jgi:hypothetical protein